MTRFRAHLVPCALVLALAPARASADEGMWTFDNPPRERLQQEYGFSPPAAWLDKIRLSSVRFMDGGSGSFVSPDGLMITNHHVGLGCIQNLSTPERDYVNEGFLAGSRAEEKACPGYEVNVLMGMEDVTRRVLAEVKAEMNDAQAREARRAAIARVENECAQKRGLRCEMVSLYQGGEYQLYAYKKYTDVRLVFAPEQQAAFFGGDPDNFTFPRHDLDVAFFRAYDGGRAVKPEAWLPWSEKGIAEGDLVFVSGNPGSTSRLDTLAQLEVERDVLLPEGLAYRKRRLELLKAFAAKSPENERRVKSTIFSLENAIKALTGRLDAVRDAQAMAAKKAREQELRARIAAQPELAREVGEAFDTIAAAQKTAAARLPESRYVGFGGSRLLGVAGDIVRYVEETRKPSEQRLEEYNQANLPSLENELFSPAPIHPDVEELTLTDQLEAARQALGPEHPFIRTVLGGRTPAEVAREVVSGTRLGDVEARRALIKGGPSAVAASTDPMIVLARRIDPLARGVRKFQEDEVSAVLTRAGQRIASARFKLLGRSVSPDATFTLRLAYGTVKGYPAQGTQVAPFTTFHGLYDRAAAFAYREPWNLSPRWREKEKSLALATPFNFVSTADIIGGNSGSPTINRQGEFVGIIFDGNIESLALDYFYTDDKARAVSVDSRGILEALREVYDADAVVEELLGK